MRIRTCYIARKAENIRENLAKCAQVNHPQTTTFSGRVYDLSDEATVEIWLENPYWQYFCGCVHFQNKFPLDPSSLVLWRKRIGEEGMEFLLQQTVLTAMKTGQLTGRHLDKINVDTTVQEKHCLSDGFESI